MSFRLSLFAPTDPFRRLPQCKTDKLTRTLARATLADDGKVILVRGAWINDFIQEITIFSNAQNDNQLDAVSLATLRLTPQIKPRKSASRTLRA